MARWRRGWGYFREEPLPFLVRGLVMPMSEPMTALFALLLVVVLAFGFAGCGVVPISGI